MLLLDRFLPDFDVSEYHDRAVSVEPERAVQLALENTAGCDRIVRTLLRLRGMGGAELPLEQFFPASGFTVLERTPTTFVVQLERRVRIVAGFWADTASGGARLATETRIARLNLAFRLYWLLIRPFSGLIRRRWLIAAAKRAAAPSP